MKRGSLRIFSRLCTLSAQPLDQLLGAASICRIDWRQRVVSDPVEVSAAVQQILRRPALTAVDAYLVRARPELSRHGRGTPAVFLNSRGGAPMGDDAGGFGGGGRNRAPAGGGGGGAGDDVAPMDDEDIPF